MLLTPRVVQLAEVPDRGATRLGENSPYIRWRPSLRERAEATRKALSMLLVHQQGTVKVGEVIRYTLTYTPSDDRILPSPHALYVKIKNHAAIPLRAAYLHGPYNIYAAAYPSTFDPNHKTKDQRRVGVPQFEPYLKPGGEWIAKLPVPEDIRETAESFASSSTPDSGDGSRSVTWILEIASQIIFSLSASTSYEMLISRDEKSLDLGWAAVAGRVRPEPGQIVDHQQKAHGKDGHHSAQSKGIYSKAIKMVVDDTASLWNKPALPEWDERPPSRRRQSRNSFTRQRSQRGDTKRVQKQQKIHLVVLTHGLHSNLGADMLYLKESIDATVRQARENRRKRKRAEPIPSDAVDCEDHAPEAPQSDKHNSTEEASTAPLSGGQDQLKQDQEDDDEEQIIVRGFNGNATRTEKGIQYLGKRMAKSILEMTYPDQPVLPVKKSMSGKISSAFSSQSSKDSQEGVPAHNHSSIQRPDEKMEKRAYKYTSISFVGHSLGGLVQLYAIAYIQKHSPTFFERIKPINFVALASPFLGLSNENPMYVKFALDFGLVGRTGQDLGLTWRPATLTRSGWSAMVGGLGVGQKEKSQGDPGSKPLLRILPTGPAHQVLRRFRNRTVYSNVVNDGIVPLRTSCLLFLDWRGLGKVDKARRENGLIGTMASWGWAEMTGQNSSPHPTASAISGDEDDDISSPPQANHIGSEVPQPAEDTTNVDDETQTTGPARRTQSFDESSRQLHIDTNTNGEATGPIDTFLNFFRPSPSSPRAPKSPKLPSKKDSKVFKRSQTLKPPGWERSGSDSGSSRRPSSEHHIPNRDDGEHGAQTHVHKRPPATRGDSILEDPTNMQAPPKTSIFESAGDLLAPPIPSGAWINDPASRVRTIWHDRVYHPEDIPPPPTKRPSRMGRTLSTDRSTWGPDSGTSSTFSDQSVSNGSSADIGGMRVEEKIARAYHRDLTWRKVLVRLEPDAHNNIVVRRMFANAYGWPVVKHLCDTHFGDTYSARTRDEDEPARDRAKDADKPIGDHGEHVKGQEDSDAPRRTASEMREATDELKPLKEAGSGESKRMARDDSGSWDEAYFRSDDEDDDEEDGRSNAFQRLLSPPPKKDKRAKQTADAEPSSPSAIKEPQIADNLTHEPDSLEELGKTQSEPSTTTPAESVASTSDVGLRKSPEEITSPPGSPKKSRGSSREWQNEEEGVAERVARLSFGKDRTHEGSQG
ncbi:DUF676-domain-containing protein [Rhizodiscina lignyota]|uniref:DUF676-domain-containing protein n=1 Tax=Rhizodiscina lignyota TaxID=1504668 RepID=A0A9P4IAX1_9PEZI|nr:DUF676-domain-containing protein [Rhizodiscina lignyota]